VYSLSRRAQLDLTQILATLIEDDVHAGVDVARHIDAILDDCMTRIADGRIPGHRRTDVRPRRELLFVVARPTRYVIAFDPATREIARIIHGARDFAKIFIET
jgi:plasmid stabilization system protein ParE